MNLTGGTKEAVLNMKINEFNNKNGVTNLIAVLDQMYLKHQSTQTYKAYERFEKFMRPHNMTIADYVIEFEQLYFKAKSFKMETLDGALAYRSLNSANLSREQK